VQPRDREETTNNTKAPTLKSILAVISANPADEHKYNNHRWKFHTKQCGKSCT
jgi:hypothetical protein